MRVLKTWWALLRLARRLDSLKGGPRACVMSIYAEPFDHLEARKQLAVLRGEQPPAREFCYGVEWFGDIAKPAKEFRGNSLGDALKGALEGTQEGLLA